MMTGATRDALLSRWFDAPVEAVWAAFTDPDQLAQWYGPNGVSVDRDSVRVEPRVGGPWALTMLVGDGRMPLSGTITEVRERERLVVTDAMPDGTLVTMTVELAEEDGGTRLELRQGPFPVEGCAGAEGAWGQAADKLAALLERR
jgi:uncharacterized protein YndB with AHSA1/START domain